MGRRDRRLAKMIPLLAAVAAFLVATTALGAGGDIQPLRRVGFGWDPADSGRGLTVRYRVTPRWDLSVAAGPNDYREDVDYSSWDADEEAADDGAAEEHDWRREQGWVRLVAGGRFWEEGRLSVRGVAGVTYRWSVEGNSRREYSQAAGNDWDYFNRNEHYDIDTWSVTLGIRPSFAVTPRLGVEFEAGLEFMRSTTDYEQLEWWDNHADTTRRVEQRHDRAFRDYGGFELYKLKFIFWF